MKFHRAFVSLVNHYFKELYQTTAAFYYDTYPVWLRELIVLLTCVIPEFEDFEDDMKVNHFALSNTLTFLTF